MFALASKKPLPRIIPPPAIVFLWVVAIGWLACCPRLQAQPSAASAESIKAGFLAAFPQFTTWPDRTFTKTNSPVVIGVLADDSFRDVLNRTARQQAGPRPLEVRQIKSLSEALECQIVFIDRADSDQEADWLNQLAGKPILTVGESGQTLARGGVLELVKDGKRIRYSVNLQAEKLAGIKLGAPLLQCAKDIKEAPQD